MEPGENFLVASLLSLQRVSEVCRYVDIRQLAMIARAYQPVIQDEEGKAASSEQQGKDLSG
jgi:hypothetical protein